MRGPSKGKKKTIEDADMYQAGRATMRTSSKPQSNELEENK